jgi:hypothetical protein
MYEVKAGTSVPVWAAIQANCAALSILDLSIAGGAKNRPSTETSELTYVS